MVDLSATDVTITSVAPDEASPPHRGIARPSGLPEDIGGPIQ
jgi:hypothetical protein